MYVLLAWFAERPAPAAAGVAAAGVGGKLARFDAALDGLVPPTYARHDLGGGDWGATVLHVADSAYRWPVVAQDGPVTAVSLGVPVGADLTGGPARLARRLLDGEDVHAGVVPPFGLLALDGADGASPRAASLQQDWLGMCRLFTGSADGVTAFCSRPGLLAAFLDGTAAPDRDGWTSYAVCGHFGGDLSPLRGVRLLSPGERVTARRRDGGGWHLTSQTRFCVDDVVAAGLAARGDRPDAALDLAAAGLTSTVSGTHELYDGEITLGLSGGKDSRLIAASFIAAGRLPRLHTNDDMVAEADAARRLVAILRDGRGLRPEHRVSPAAAPAAVLDVGLRERVTRMQRLHDYQFPSTFTIRPATQVRLPAHARAATLTGAGGGLAVGHWYPADPAVDARDRAVAEHALRPLFGAAPAAALAAPALAREKARIADLVSHAEGVGLRGLELIDYVHLLERVRRWATSGYFVGMVTPFLAPAFVAATFAVTPAQKRARLLHTGLLERFLPEWSAVPFVVNQSAPSKATRVWEGDGTQVLCDLLDTAGGELPDLVSREAVEAALVRAVRGTATGADQKLLQQFAWLALAAEQLEPAATRPATGAAYARVTRPPRQRDRRLGALAARVASVRRSRFGRRLWGAVSRRRRPGTTGRTRAG